MGNRENARILRQQLESSTSSHCIEELKALYDDLAQRVEALEALLSNDKEESKEQEPQEKKNQKGK